MSCVLSERWSTLSVCDDKTYCARARRTLTNELTIASLTPLQQILSSYRAASVTEREKGIYFEELICVYLRNEPTYADLYSDV